MHVASDKNYKALPRKVNHYLMDLPGHTKIFSFMNLARLLENVNSMCKCYVTKCPYVYIVVLWWSCNNKCNSLVAISRRVARERGTYSDHEKYFEFLLYYPSLMGLNL